MANLERNAALFGALAIALSACATPTEEAMPMEEEMVMEEDELDMDQDMAVGDGDMDMEEGEEHGAEMHEAAEGGQVGMAMGAAADGSDFHLELVSMAPGTYMVYLSDTDRTPVSPEGYEGTLALINPDGSVIESFPFMVMSDLLMAEGGPTDLSQADVRITLKGPDLAGTLEMEFSIVY